MLALLVVRSPLCSSIETSSKSPEAHTSLRPSCHCTAHNAGYFAVFHWLYWYCGSSWMVRRSCGVLPADGEPKHRNEATTRTMSALNLGRKSSSFSDNWLRTNDRSDSRQKTQNSYAIENVECCVTTSGLVFDSADDATPETPGVGCDGCGFLPNRKLNIFSACLRQSAGILKETEIPYCLTPTEQEIQWF